MGLDMWSQALSCMQIINIWYNSKFKRCLNKLLLKLICLHKSLVMLQLTNFQKHMYHTIDHNICLRKCRKRMIDVDNDVFKSIGDGATKINRKLTNITNHNHMGSRNGHGSGQQIMLSHDKNKGIPLVSIAYVRKCYSLNNYTSACLHLLCKQSVISIVKTMSADKTLHYEGLYIKISRYHNRDFHLNDNVVNQIDTIFKEPTKASLEFCSMQLPCQKHQHWKGTHHQNDHFSCMSQYITTFIDNRWSLHI